MALLWHSRLQGSESVALIGAEWHRSGAIVARRRWAAGLGQMLAWISAATARLAAKAHRSVFASVGTSPLAR